MNNYLNILAKEVLHTQPQGISKVRFAKIIYFVHKGLVQWNIATVEQLQFIRMPLGPVPVGFKELTDDVMIEVTEIKNSSLTYNAQTYKLRNNTIDIASKYESYIKQIVENLKPLQTSELIEISHKEPSWLHFQNGDEYYLSKEDLQQSLPTRKTTSDISKEMDDQRIQARLVEGMLSDIVDESTSLEYPKQ